MYISSLVHLLNSVYRHFGVSFELLLYQIFVLINYYSIIEKVSVTRQGSCSKFLHYQEVMMGTCQ